MIVLDRRGAIRGVSWRGAAEEEASRHSDALIDDNEDDDHIVVVAGLDAAASRGERDAESIADVTKRAPGLKGGSEAAWSVGIGERENKGTLETKSRKKCLDDKVVRLNKKITPLSSLGFVFRCCPFFPLPGFVMRASLASSHASSGCISSRASLGQQRQQQERKLFARPQLMPLSSRSPLAAAASPSSPLSSAASASSSRPASHLAASTSAPSRLAVWRDISLAAAGRTARKVLLSGWRPER